MLRQIISWFFQLVFWWKKRTGWIDLKQTVTATGVVVGMDDGPSSDGDFNFRVKVDENCEWLITGFGGRLTTDDPKLGPSLLCEVVPWSPVEVQREAARLHVGDRVSVTGAWGFDGVHVSGSRWWNILLAIFRHQPNVLEGWLELHPVTELTIVSRVRP